MTTLPEEHLKLGGDPGGCAEFAALGTELAKLNHPACPDVDWPRVERLCLTLFREHGLELQSATAFALARSQLHGLDGMDDGLRLLYRLLVQDWERLWPPALPVRLETLTWLFAQLQPLLRRQELSVERMPALRDLDEALGRLNEWLAQQTQMPLVSLQALCKQVQGMLQRLTRDVATTGEGQAPASALASDSVGEGESVPRKPFGARRRRAVSTTASPAPAVVVLKLDTTEPDSVPAPSDTPVRRRRVLWPWLLMLGLLIFLTGLTGLLGWWTGDAPTVSSSDLPAAPKPSVTAAPPEPAMAAPIRLDSLLLFPAGSAELKPGSTKVLINGLINVKAQPGWLIVISGHSDTSGNPQRNLELSRARAEAVKDWMQRMGDIPDGCFIVQGQGAGQPIASNDTESGRRANRRVDIQLVPSAGACTARGH